MTEKLKTAAKPALDTFVYELKIPRDRVAVIIGQKGETKRELQRLTNTKIEVESTEGIVTLSGKDALGLYTGREIINAIGRGFSPERAELLLDPENGYETMNLKDYARNETDLIRLRGRIIGEDGKSRRVIEEMTDVHISVYGKTVGLLGNIEGLPVARRAIQAILGGSRHATVFRWLEGQRRKLRERRMQGGSF